MLTVILALTAGAVAGYLGIFKTAARYVAGPLSTAGVVLLLFFLGAKIGADREIMNGLAVMGLEALAYAMATIAGSLLVVGAWQLLERRTRKDKQEREGA